MRASIWGCGCWILENEHAEFMPKPDDQKSLKRKMDYCLTVN